MPSQDIIKEFLRKGIHLTSIIIILVYAYLGKQAVLNLLIVYLVAILIIEHFRLEYGIKLPIFNSLFREKENSSLGGHVFFTVGAITAISVFSREIAYVALLMTTFGDMSAALIGKTFGRNRIKNGKSLEGCAAEFVVNLGIGYAILESWTIAIVMALTATIVETAVSKVDDNLAIPVLSGFSGQVALLIKSLL